MSTGTAGRVRDNRTVVLVAAGVALIPAAVALVDRPFGDVLARAVAAIVIFSGVGLFVLALRPAPTPAAFAVRGGAFVVPSNLAWACFVGGQTVLAGCLASAAAAMPPWTDDPLGKVLAVAVLLLAAAVVPSFANVLRGRPWIELTPDGVTLRRPFGRAYIPWEALAPEPLLPASDALRLVFNPNLVTRTGLGGRKTRSSMPLNYLAVHAGFLVNAIRYYASHPDERATIGTPAGHDRLVDAIAAPAVTLH